MNHDVNPNESDYVEVILDPARPIPPRKSGRQRSKQVTNKEPRQTLKDYLDGGGKISRIIRSDGVPAMKDHNVTFVERSRARQADKNGGKKFNWR